jgi:hypothetical protein
MNINNAIWAMSIRGTPKGDMKEAKCCHLPDKLEFTCLVP